jgi:hypothetical protein
MSKGATNRAAQNAKLHCSSFIECFWNESDKCMIYSFRNAMDAANFKYQRKLQDSKNKMVIKIFHGNLTSLTEYVGESPLIPN